MCLVVLFFSCAFAEGEALLKIVDFGGSGIVLLDHGEEEEGLTTPTGCTPGYRAPEMLSAQYGRAVVR
jgi:hypothetical protein